YNAGPVAAGGASVQGFDYDHDTHGRREVVRPWLPEGTPAPAEQPPGWKYGYNERGEVEVADRFTAEAGPETGIVGHQRRSYAYDLMGNRDTATQGTAAAELRQTGYSANILQQYNGLTHSCSVEITGQAVAGATVELTLDAGTPITVDRSLPQHQTGDPHSFRYVHAVAGTEARWLHVQIKASAGGINLTRQGFVYVPPASETVVHDDDGNLTEDAQWEYTWDAENRMTSATQKSLPVAAGVSTPPPARKKLTFAHDHRNRRIAKRVFEQRTENSELIWKLVKDLRFVHDGYQMIAELDHTFATGTGLAGSRVTRTFLWGPDVSGTMSGAGGVGGLLNTTYQGVSYQVCSDANGNVTGLVPTSGPGAGTLVARFDYDPFGNRITNTGPDVELCPFGFSTKYTDSETGIVNYELRPYQPGTGRFMCPDPIEERGGVNLYGFVGNDAVNEWDYLGLNYGSIGVVGKAPNCEVILMVSHGPNHSTQWYLSWLRKVGALAQQSGLSPELVTNGTHPFYGSAAVIACHHPAGDRLWTPGVKGNPEVEKLMGGVGPPNPKSGGHVGPSFGRHLASTGYPYTNGGHGDTHQAYLEYIKESIDLSLKHASKLAADCSKDPCCQCKKITMKFVLDDIQRGRHGNTAKGDYKHWRNISNEPKVFNSNNQLPSSNYPGINKQGPLDPFPLGETEYEFFVK
ncbi:MAG TPA: hypothetical protein DDZ88_18065, partial [Verrucomicrobiales bacterium]|nr:hypothetical protein [Verrucomicrobiales bacterium]